MQLSCPHCGFSREVDPARVPAGAVRVTCPRCKEPFSFHRQETAQQATRETSSPPPAEESPAAPPAETEHLAAAAPVPAPPAERPKAGFWIRLAAFLVDSVLVSVLEFVLSFLLLQAAALAGVPVSQEDFLIYLTLQFFNMVLTWAYFVYFTGYRGQTPGKMLLKIRVVRTDGMPVGYGRAFLREVPAKLLSGILLGIGFLMVAFHPKKQGLHDLIADTYVVKT